MLLAAETNDFRVSRERVRAGRKRIGAQPLRRGDVAHPRDTGADKATRVRESDAGQDRYAYIYLLFR